MKHLHGGVAVVIGGAHGIGLALVQVLSEEGMHVVIADIDEDALAEAQQALAECGVDVVAIRTDVGNPDEVQALADTCFETFGAVQLLCANAGVLGPQGIPMWEVDLAEWERAFRVNVWGVIHGIRSFVPRMLGSGTECHVVVTSSMAGFYSSAMMPQYFASKRATVALTESLRDQAEKLYPRLGVSLLCPGPVETGLVARESQRLEALGRHAEAYDGLLVDEAIDSSGRAPSYVRMSAVAWATVEAIKARRFYIFPNPGSTQRIADRWASTQAGFRDSYPESSST